MAWTEIRDEFGESHFGFSLDLLMTFPRFMGNPVGIRWGSQGIGTRNWARCKNITWHLGMKMSWHCISSWSAPRWMQVGSQDFSGKYIFFFKCRCVWKNGVLWNPSITDSERGIAYINLIIYNNIIYIYIVLYCIILYYIILYYIILYTLPGKNDSSCFFSPKPSPSVRTAEVGMLSTSSPFQGALICFRIGQRRWWEI